MYFLCAQRNWKQNVRKNFSIQIIFINVIISMILANLINSLINNNKLYTYDYININLK